MGGPIASSITAAGKAQALLGDSPLTKLERKYGSNSPELIRPENLAAEAAWKNQMIEVGRQANEAERAAARIVLENEPMLGELAAQFALFALRAEAAPGVAPNPADVPITAFDLDLRNPDVQRLAEAGLEALQRMYRRGPEQFARQLNFVEQAYGAAGSELLIRRGGGRIWEAETRKVSGERSLNVRWTSPTAPFDVYLPSAGLAGDLTTTNPRTQQRHFDRGVIDFLVGHELRPEFVQEVRASLSRSLLVETRGEALQHIQAVRDARARARVRSQARRTK